LIAGEFSTSMLMEVEEGFFLKNRTAGLKRR